MFSKNIYLFIVKNKILLLKNDEWQYNYDQIMFEKYYFRQKIRIVKILRYSNWRKFE